MMSIRVIKLPEPTTGILLTMGLSFTSSRGVNQHPRESLTAVDLFAGAGGSTQGLRKAGYRVLGAVENDRDCISSYRKNHPSTTLYDCDIEKVRPQALRRAIGLKKGELTLLNACPPCQGFSTLGLGNKSDGRNDLVSLVFPFIGELRPAAFIIENVPGLRSDTRLHQLIAQAKTIGYGLRVNLVNATDFGVPQNRKRLIVIGVLNLSDDELPKQLDQLLPKSFRRKAADVSKVIARAGKIENSRDPIHRSRQSRPEVLERIKHIPVGGGRFDLPVKYQLPCHRKLGKGATASYGRMPLKGPAPTLTTRCTTPACGRYVHPTEHRGISLREAALIQTFPLKYKFSGNYQEIEAQIGNAVPVRMAHALALVARQLVPERAYA